MARTRVAQASLQRRQDGGPCRSRACPASLWVLLAVWSCCAIGCRAGEPATSDLMLRAANKVYEEGGSYVNKPPAQYSEWLEEIPARLRAHKAWWSNRTLTYDYPVTVVTVATASRLYQLEAQCSSWAGRLSAAVYLPVVVPRQASKEQAAAAASTALADAEKKVAQLHAWAEQHTGSSGCFLDVLLLYELISEEPLMGLMFPVNSLRNFALVQARTPLVALIDVDLLVSRTLSTWLDSPNNARLLQERCKGRTVVVLPAFETEEFPTSTEDRHLATAHKVSAATVKSDKRTVLSAMVAQGLVHQFDKYTHLAGHYDTNYTAWFNATDMYAANLTKPTYEPWFIIGREHVPLYDVRFRGFGYNKQVHILVLRKLGFQFLVHPEGFLVHRAHPRAPASKAYVSKNSAGDASDLRRNVTRFFSKHMDQVAAGTYHPCVDDALLSCHSSLPWAFPIKDPQCVPYLAPEDRNKPFVNFDEKPKAQVSTNSSSSSSSGGSSNNSSSSSSSSGAGGTSSSSSNSSSSSSQGAASPAAEDPQKKAHHRPAASWHKVKMMLRLF